MKQKTQWKDVLQHLRTNDGITSMQAWDMYHITRLSDVIFKLRKRGYEIETVTCTGYNEYGVYQYAEYRLIKEAN